MSLPTSRILIRGVPFSRVNLADLKAYPLKTVAISPSSTRSQDLCFPRRGFFDFSTLYFAEPKEQTIKISN